MTQRFEPVSGDEAQAARALLAERDQLRTDLAFALEYIYQLIVWPPPVPAANEQRWYQLYRQYEQEEWFREAKR